MDDKKLKELGARLNALVGRIATACTLSETVEEAMSCKEEPHCDAVAAINDLWGDILEALDGIASEFPSGKEARV